MNNEKSGNSLMETDLPLRDISYTLLLIHPYLQHDQLTKRDGVPQKCSRGHQWDFGFKVTGISLDMTSWGITEGEEKFCIFCLRDLLREKCGRVSEVK